MSRREVFSIALKLMGVFFLLQGLASLPMVLPMVFSGPFDTGIASVGFMLGAGLYVVAALVLIVWGNGIAGRLAEREGAESPRPAVDRFDLQYVGFSVLGLWAMLSSLGAVVGQLLVNSTFFGGDWATGLGWAHFAGPLAMFLAGLALLFGAQALVNLLRRARNAGHPPAN